MYKPFNQLFLHTIQTEVLKHFTSESNTNPFKNSILNTVYLKMQLLEMQPKGWYKRKQISSN